MVGKRALNNIEACSDIAHRIHNVYRHRRIMGRESRYSRPHTTNSGTNSPGGAVVAASGVPY